MRRAAHPCLRWGCRAFCGSRASCGFGRLASKAVPALWGGGAGQVSGCVPLSLEKKPAAKKSSQLLAPYSADLPMDVRPLRAVAFGVRLQSLMALHRLRSSNAPRSVVFELRGRAQKLPSLLATPFRPPEGKPPFVLRCDKRSKNASAFFDLWIQRNRNQRKLIYNSCRRFLRLPSPSLRSGEWKDHPSQQRCKGSRNREDSGKDRSAQADRPRVRCRKICPRRWRQSATANFSFRLLAFMQSSRSADAASLF